jgi:hypothetical protein
MTKQAALQKVESLSRKIATSETSLEGWKWQRAEAMAAAADAGATQREIAKAAGFRNHQPVADAIKIVARYPSQPRPPYSEAYDNVTGFDRDAAQDRTDRARTKRTLAKSDPEQIAEQILNDPEIRLNVGKALDLHYKEREQKAKQREREVLGDETVDDLELKQRLTDAEMLLIKARGNLRGFVKDMTAIGDDVPDAWRTSCLDWIADLEGHLGMSKALLEGGTLSEDDLQALLKG